ncbi:serine hydrolase domain-containing protein [Streptomyces sp. NPDC002328]|uniref:serine hydrolase domain-containing protein n=1 Tax=Streptomyces sp. NPDC002328 TaxID=3364642 RepID=UPI00367CA3DD
MSNRRSMRASVVALTLAGLLGTATAAAVADTGGTGDSGRPGRHGETQRAMDAVVADGVPGVTGQAVDRYGVWTGTAGVADIVTERPRKGQDRYRIGSITKTFVATVLLQLQAEGRLDLDDSVERWLPGVVRGNGHDGRKISVRQLLNHTSGIHNYTETPEFGQKVFGPGFLQHRYDSWSARRLVRLAMDHEPVFPPGADWSYSNTNYVLAGLVIEKVTGRPYGVEVRDRIVKPLRLRSTTVPGTDPRMPRPAGRAYSKLLQDPAGPTYDVTELNPSIARAAGEIISNSSDLNAFTSALVRGRLLPPAELEELTTTVPAGEEQPPGSATYGLGLMKVKLSCGKELWGHTGGIHGSLSVAMTTRDGGHSLALNLNGDWAGDPIAVVEAEYCGTVPATTGDRSAAQRMPIL